MKTLGIIFMAFSCLSCSSRTSRGKAPITTMVRKTIPIDIAVTRKRLKEQATDIANAVVVADFEKVADMTHPNSLEMMGGRDRVIAFQKKSREKSIASGAKIEIERVDDPGDIVESQSVLYSYVPVIARIYRRIPKQVLLMKSIFIAVSGNEGKTWKFVDDSGIPSREIVEQMFLNWPPKLKLPPKEAPTIIEE